MEYKNLKLYTEILTPAERIKFIKRGFANTLKEKGITKSAAWNPFTIPGQLTNALIGLSILVGVPGGIAAHRAGRIVKNKRIQEHELQERLNYYRNLSENLESMKPPQDETNKE